MQTEAEITSFAPNHEARAWAQKWELENSLGKFNARAKSFCKEKFSGEIDFDKKEYSKAFEHFKSAAKNGCVMAMTNLGHCYSEGLGCKQSNTRVSRCKIFIN